MLYGFLIGAAVAAHEEDEIDAGEDKGDEASNVDGVFSHRTAFENRIADGLNLIGVKGGVDLGVDMAYHVLGEGVLLGGIAH